MNRLRQGVAAIVVTVIASFAFAGTAQASPAAARQARVALTHECTVDPATVHKGDDLAAVCATHAGAARPANTVGGNCGSSYLYIYNLGSGTAAFSSGAHATGGTIEFGSATISWTNTHNWNFDQINLYVSGAYWSDWNDRYTGSGTVVADMSGDVLVSNGSICSFDYPSDVENIS